VAIARFCYLPPRCINARGFCLSLSLRRLPPSHPSTAPLPPPWISPESVADPPYPRPGAAVPRPGFTTSSSSPHNCVACPRRTPPPRPRPCLRRRERDPHGGSEACGGSEVRERDPHGVPVPVPIRAWDAHGCGRVSGAGCGAQAGVGVYGEIAASPRRLPHRASARAKSGRLDSYTMPPPPPRNPRSHGTLTKNPTQR
jgi:hypothetical protein